MRFETKAIHSGGEIDHETGALAPPLHLSTTFERIAGYSYVRDGNPTQTRLEEALASIDGGEAALAFASGMAAATALLQSLPPGSHVVLPSDGYYAVREIGEQFLPRWGMSCDFDQPMRENTKAVWCESPSNPLMKIADIAALADRAHERGAILIVDGTFASPALQRPLELGADVVMHSTTKYLGGHSDVHGGAAVFAKRDEFYERVLHTRTVTGGIASPFNAWLVLRGIRSLAARMRVHCENARLVACFLESHPGVEVVHYPGLESHPGHEIAKKQMSDFGGMMSFRVRGGRDEALAVAARTQVFTRATSLGGVESLIEHRASSEGPTTRAPENLLRLSVGLEHADDLIADLAHALGVTS